MEILTFDRGDIIIREGVREQRAYLIQSGRIEIYREIHGHRTTLAILSVNQIFGEMALFDDRPRSANAMALEPTTVMVFYKDLVDKELAKLEPWMKGFFKIVVSRLRKANDDINPMNRAHYFYSALQFVSLLVKTRPSALFQSRDLINQMRRMIHINDENSEDLLKTLEIYRLMVRTNREGEGEVLSFPSIQTIDSVCDLLADQLFSPSPRELTKQREHLDASVEFLKQVLTIHEKEQGQKEKHFIKAPQISMAGKACEFPAMVVFLRAQSLEGNFLLGDNESFHYSYPEIKKLLISLAKQRMVVNAAISLLAPQSA